MDAIGSLALASGLSWASSLRLYATVCVVGLLARYGYVQLPDGLAILTHPWIISCAGVMLCIEFLADKFPLVDSAWDSVHTFIRIPAGALLAMGAMDNGDPLTMTLFALLGGALAGGTHFAKAGSRALINTSPEPVSNWAASFSEEGILVLGLWLMLVHPALFLLGMALFILLLLWWLPKLWHGMSLVWRRVVS